MRVSIILIGLGLGAALITGPVQAQTNDHLQCYQVKGDLKLKGLLDLTTPQFGLEEGCKINKAKFFCVPATKSNVDVVDRDKQPVTPLPFSAPPAPGDRICWKVKCPEPFPDDQTVTDQFGTQTLTKFKTKLLCTPAVKGTVFCGDGTVNGSEVCEPTDDSACPGLCQADCSCGVAPPTCGNGSIDGNDDCDDPDLGGATCESLGFESGTLACTIGCGLDVSGCTPVPSGTCGNGSIDGNDDCDGLDLGGATCESLGFQGGTLACSAGCGLDVSGCVATCGNGTLDPGEDCDFGDLGGATCRDQGFIIGTLACGAGCTFDTSGCTNQCPAGAMEVGGACWYLGSGQPFSEQSCGTVCTNVGLAYDAATETYAGSGGTDLQCEAVLTALGVPGVVSSIDCTLFGGLGCHFFSFDVFESQRCFTPVTDSSSSFSFFERACACQ